MEVNDFVILLIDVKLYLQHVQKLAFNVLIKNEETTLFKSIPLLIYNYNRFSRKHMVDSDK